MGMGMALADAAAATLGARAPFRSASARGLPRGQHESLLSLRQPVSLRVRAVTSGGDKKQSSSTSEEVEEVTKKWGLEAGLWKALRSGGSQKEPERPQEAAGTGSSEQEGEGQSKSNTEVAKELLAKYGAGYLATSISLSIVSFAFFYVLVDRGVDVASVLQQLGIEVDSTKETVGTVALAYAAHKAASPIRFPPTVLLTPIVADFFSKKNKEDA